MTVQRRENLIYKGKNYYFDPTFHQDLLRPYLKSKGICFYAPTTACWRGYIGDWLIEDKKLYLIHLRAYIKHNSDEVKVVGLDYLFPGQTKVFAHWFSGEIRVPNGQLMAQIRWKYLDEKEFSFKIEEGIVEERIIDNTHYYNELGADKKCIPKSLRWIGGNISEKIYFFQQIQNQNDSPNNVNNNRMKGAIFGQAIGDALGLGTLYMSHKEVLQNYPNGLEFYDQIVLDLYRCIDLDWRKPGEWKGSTDMMLCVAYAMIIDRKINLNSVVRNFLNWYRKNQDRTLAGINFYTCKVLDTDGYEEKPIEKAWMNWVLFGENEASNEALMRASIVGLWEKDVAFYAEKICKLTHTDPRCIGSCVIIAELVHYFVWKGQELSFDDMLRMSRIYDKRIETYLLLAKEGSLEDLKLDDDIHYTLKALSATIWSLYHVDNFKDGLLAIVNAGGDANINAAVTCSVLGAKYGFESIPSSYIDNLCHKDVLEKVSKNLYRLCSVQNYRHSLNVIAKTCSDIFKTIGQKLKNNKL